MRICIIGGGLAGALLAWRLRQLSPSAAIDLAIGLPGDPAAVRDATAASGGGVRAYEPDPIARAYATESLAELLDSCTLREWSGYRRIGSTYLRARWPGAEIEIAAINAALPGSAGLADATELKEFGWAGLPPETVGVVETQAGHLSPDAFRRAVLAELSTDARVRVLAVPARPLSSLTAGALSCRIGGEVNAYDRVVVAAGAWTPAILAKLGVAANSCGVVKAIQYALHPAIGALPTFFVDETTGLYGRPVKSRTMLLGIPVTAYGGPADGGRADPALVARAADLAAERLPHIRLAPATVTVRSADCYRAPHTLTLQAVEDRPSVLTFTGGSGGSAKTALAASRHAAAQLIADSVAPRPPASAHTGSASRSTENALREG